MADETRADLETLWTAIFALYRSRPAVGTMGAEVVGLVLEAEDLIASGPVACTAIHRAGQLLRDLWEPAA